MRMKRKGKRDEDEEDIDFIPETGELKLSERRVTQLKKLAKKLSK
jgi:hypothetical protein